MVTRSFPDSVSLILGQTEWPGLAALHSIVLPLQIPQMLVLHCCYWKLTTKFIFTRGCAVTRCSPCASPRPAPSPRRTQKSSNSSPSTGGCWRSPSSMLMKYDIVYYIWYNQSVGGGWSAKSRSSSSSIRSSLTKLLLGFWRVGMRITGSGPVISIRSQYCTMYLT